MVRPARKDARIFILHPAFTRTIAALHEPGVGHIDVERKMLDHECRVQDSTIQPERPALAVRCSRAGSSVRLLHESTCMVVEEFSRPPRLRAMRRKTTSCRSSAWMHSASLSAPTGRYRCNSRSAMTTSLGCAALGEQHCFER